MALDTKKHREFDPMTLVIIACWVVWVAFVVSIWYFSLTGIWTDYASTASKRGGTAMFITFGGACTVGGTFGMAYLHYFLRER